MSTRIGTITQMEGDVTVSQFCGPTALQRAVGTRLCLQLRSFDGVVINLDVKGAARLGRMLTSWAENSTPVED